MNDGRPCPRASAGRRRAARRAQAVDEGLPDSIPLIGADHVEVAAEWIFGWISPGAQPAGALQLGQDVTELGDDAGISVVSEDAGRGFGTPLAEMPKYTCPR